MHACRVLGQGVARFELPLVWAQPADVGKVFHMSFCVSLDLVLVVKQFATTLAKVLGRCFVWNSFDQSVDGGIQRGI